MPLLHHLIYTLQYKYFDGNRIRKIYIYIYISITTCSIYVYATAAFADTHTRVLQYYTSPAKQETNTFLLPIYRSWSQFRGTEISISSLYRLSIYRFSVFFQVAVSILNTNFHFYAPVFNFLIHLYWFWFLRMSVSSPA